MTATKIITAAEVKAWNLKGFVVFPYPRQKRISLNGGASKPATKEALIEARKFLNSKKV